MRKPSITIVQRGKADRYGRKRLYLSYAWQYRTNYISLGWKVAPEDWLKTSQSVRLKAIIGGAGAARVNADLNEKIAKAERIVMDMVSEFQPLDFDTFKEQFADTATKSAQMDFAEAAEKVLTLEVQSGQISTATHEVYRYAVKKFAKVIGKTNLGSITRMKVLQFKASLSTMHNANIAAQYTRNCGIVYRKIIKMFRLPDNKAFDDIDTNVERLSGKKQLPDAEFALLRTAFLESEPGSERAELLRRFLFMAKGLRFSDTLLLSKEHYFEFVEGDTTFRYFTKPSQKTGEMNIVPILPDEAEMLLIWQSDGKAFAPTTYNAYLPKLKRLSKEIIGHPITTHFGRHYAGDSILNTEGLSRDDVQKILGISSANIADIYAQRDVKVFLREFYRIVANK